MVGNTRYKVKLILFISFEFLQTDSSSASAVTPSKKKSLIDQFFGVEFETTYPLSQDLYRLSHNLPEVN